MIDFSNIKSIYMAQGCTDLRKGIDGYASIIQNYFSLSPFDDALYIFAIDTAIKSNVFIGMAVDFGFYIKGWKTDISSG